ncbi:hypothetical protein TNCV_2477311 [Trichonephila clavipes]|nr:hypothetical protein TNCV_2477311 [Trichonephila clavipes]
MFFAKKDFTLSVRTVKSGVIHFIQTKHVPMLIYELPVSILKCRAQPNMVRSFEPYDQMLYHRTILDNLFPQLIQKVFHVENFRKMNCLTKHVTSFLHLPHVPAKKRPLEEKSLPFSKRRSKVRITPVIRRLSRPPEIPMAPVQISQPIPQSPMQIPQSLVPEPGQIPQSLVPEPVQIPESPVPEPPVQI